MTGVVGVPPASASIGTAAAMLASVSRCVRVWVAMIVSSSQGHRGEGGGGELPGTPPPSAYCFGFTSIERLKQAGWPLRRSGREHSEGGALSLPKGGFI